MVGQRELRNEALLENLRNVPKQRSHSNTPIHILSSALSLNITAQDYFLLSTSTVFTSYCFSYNLLSTCCVPGTGLNSWLELFGRTLKWGNIALNKGEKLRPSGQGLTGNGSERVQAEGVSPWPKLCPPLSSTCQAFLLLWCWALICPPPGV